jgi:hypothetical protein
MPPVFVGGVDPAQVRSVGKTFLAGQQNVISDAPQQVGAPVTAASFSHFEPEKPPVRLSLLLVPFSIMTGIDGARQEHHERAVIPPFESVVGPLSDWMWRN